jgi:hypothetical protein
MDDVGTIEQQKTIAESSSDRSRPTIWIPMTSGINSCLTSKIWQTIVKTQIVSNNKCGSTREHNKYPKCSKKTKLKQEAIGVKTDYLRMNRSILEGTNAVSLGTFEKSEVIP